MADRVLQSIDIPELNATLVNTPPTVAPTFDPSETYSVGDRVYYNRKLYRFKSAHAVGAWNANEVDEVTIDSELTKLNGDITELDEDKVGFTDYASMLSSGVVKVGNGLKINAETGYLAISPANSLLIKSGTNETQPLVAARQHESAFYGLAKASGDTTQSKSSNPVGIYTETAQSKIHEMLDAPVTVSGTTPTITGKAGIRYICGEVSTLSITPPASGIVDVIFTSGSTPTVLTVPSTVKFPDAFDSTNLDANTVYEINILDGIYGLVSAWT